MSRIKRDCPHCHTKSVSFSSFGQQMKPEGKIYTTVFFCENCYGGYVVEIQHKGGDTPHPRHGNIENIPNYGFLKEYPIPIAISSPDHLPENIDTFYTQAADSLRSGNFDASAIMSRKVLEVAVKKINPKGKGTLYKRIEELANIGKITEDLKDWAHVIRDNGNEAAHEEEPVSPDFAEEILSFAEMFLLYTFTMPKMIASRRHLREDNE